MKYFWGFILAALAAYHIPKMFEFNNIALCVDNFLSNILSPTGNGMRKSKWLILMLFILIFGLVGLSKKSSK
jgi:hypothetical protein